MNEENITIDDMIDALVTHEHDFEYMCKHDEIYTIKNKQVLANYLKYYFQYIKRLYKIDILEIVNNKRNQGETKHES